MNSPLCLTHIRKKFGRQPVLSGLSLELSEGELFGLFGLNGAGKTTLIKAVLDILSLDQGTITLFGEPHTQPKSRRHLYYLPEKFAPSPSLTGRDFIRLSTQAYGVSVSDEAIEEMAQALGFPLEAIRKPLRNYSKGMGQKIGLLAGLLSQRPLLMLDEPMSGLDPQARLQLRHALKAYQAQKRTLFITSHLLADAEVLCDRVGILHQGKLLFVGTVAALRKQTGSKDLEQAFLQIIQPSLAEIPA